MSRVTHADFAQRYQQYFFPTCTHFATNWINFSYWWGKTETFIHLLFFAETLLCRLITDSALQLAGFHYTEWTATQISPAKQKAEVFLHQQRLV